MKVVFISTPSRLHLPNYVVPTGILSISSYLEALHHDVVVVDAAALNEPIDITIQRIVDEKPEVIGISAIITAYKFTINMVRSIRKELPEVPIVLGGQLTINTSHLFFKYTSVDFIVHGYGEIAMGKLIDYFEEKISLDDIPGISYKLNEKIIENPGRDFFDHVDSMPLPAYHLINMEHYATVRGENKRLIEYLEATGKTIDNHRFINVMGTLGCTDMCTFCVHEQEFVGLKIFSNEYLISHMEFLHRKYDINVFGIGEEMFLTTPKRLKKFNKLMKDRLPNVFWTSSTRGNHITKDLVDELVENSNCFNVGWGLESGSDKVLTLMKKRMTRHENLTAYNNLIKTPIRPSGSLMVGNIGEDLYTILETIAFIKETNMPFIQPFFATPYPGSRIWDWALERGLIEGQHQFLLKVSNLDITDKIHCNMTPFPDFILKGFSSLIAYESYKNSFFHQKSGLLGFSISNIKIFVSAVTGPGYIPMPLMKINLRIYQYLHDLRRKIFTIKNDEVYNFKIDDESAMRPEKLIVMSPQKRVKSVDVASVKVSIKQNRLSVIASSSDDN